MDNNAKNLPTGQVISGISSKNCDIMQLYMNCEEVMTKNPTEGDANTNTNISDIPSFHSPQVFLPEISDETRSALANMSKLVDSRELYRNEILADADRMGVPYRLNIQYSDEWADFVDEVYNYEELLTEAHSYNIAWDLSEYDPQALNTLIDKARNDVWRAEKSVMRDYYSALGVEA